MSSRTILERMGGINALEQIIEYFYARILLDLKIKHYFAKSNMKQLRDHQAKFITSLLSEKDMYSGEYMMKAHKGLKITEVDFNRVVLYLEEALCNANVPIDITKLLISTVESFQKYIVNL